MNREDIVSWRNAADIAARKAIGMRAEFHPDWHLVRDQKFAELVAAAERFACEKACKSIHIFEEGGFSDAFENGAREGITWCIESIRAREQV